MWFAIQCAAPKSSLHPRNFEGSDLLLAALHYRKLQSTARRENKEMVHFWQDLPSVYVHCAVCIIGARPYAWLLTNCGVRFFRCKNMTKKVEIRQPLAPHLLIEWPLMVEVFNNGKKGDFVCGSSVEFTKERVFFFQEKYTFKGFTKSHFWVLRSW